VEYSDNGLNLPRTQFRQGVAARKSARDLQQIHAGANPTFINQGLVIQADCEGGATLL
jgi:hypothetical protein